MVTTKEKPIVDTEKILIKESKHTATKSTQISKDENIRRSKEQNIQKTINKRQKQVPTYHQLL